MPCSSADVPVYLSHDDYWAMKRLADEDGVTLQQHLHEAVRRFVAQCAEEDEFAKEQQADARKDGGA